MIDKYTFVIDVDGTLCPIKKTDQNYSDLIPFPDMVKRMKEYKSHGAKIILYTSRNMNTYSGNIGLINKNTAPTLIEWLKRWDIPYDEIVFGKVWPGHKGFYIDDRSIRPSEFLEMDIDELEKRCNEGRCRP